VFGKTALKIRVSAAAIRSVIEEDSLMAMQQLIYFFLVIKLIVF
jgi:ribosomal protein L28